MNSYPPISELEKRMRPGAWSEGGFLGPTESLQNVIACDDQTLAQLGLTHETMAHALAGIIERALDQKRALLESEYAEYRRREDVPWVNGPEPVPCFSLDNLPPADVGYLVDEKYQLFFASYRGWQNCPWGCEYDTTQDTGLGYFDFLLLNRESAAYIIPPGLIVHLIREHHFFEGPESPYRTDPAQLARVLELEPGMKR